MREDDRLSRVDMNINKAGAREGKLIYSSSETPTPLTANSRVEVVGVVLFLTRIWRFTKQQQILAYI